MYNYLTESVSRLVIGELREFWGGHPNWKDLVTNIQGTYAFAERPQHSIVVRASSASQQRLSAQNYKGVDFSYVALAGIPGYAGRSVEWVREDALAIQANGGAFPTPPGVYYCEVRGTPEAFDLYVTPLYEVRAEVPMFSGPSEFTLSEIPIAGSLRVYEVPSGRRLATGVDYSLRDDGSYGLAEPLPRGVHLSADYRYSGEEVGPYRVEPLFGYPRILPGVVFAFGRWLAVGDRFAVVVSETREEAAHIYGGRWEVSVELDLSTRDVNARAEIVDQTAMHLLMDFREKVIAYGVEVADVSLGGNSEDVYDENGDDYFYNASISMTVQTEWESYRPILGRIAAYSESTVALPLQYQIAPYRDPYYCRTRYSHPSVL